MERQGRTSLARKFDVAPDRFPRQPREIESLRLFTGSRSAANRPVRAAAAEEDELDELWDNVPV